MMSLREVLSESKEKQDLQHIFRSLDYFISRLKKTFEESLKSEEFSASVNKNDLERKFGQLDIALNDIKRIVEKSR